MSMSAGDEHQAHDERPVIIGGYRVVRALGVGTRATVWVGHSAGQGDAPSVALKVLAGDADDIAAEVSAYERVDSRHVARLLDVCSGPDATVCVVLERLDGGSLASLVHQRRRIRTGEAVTILVSVLRGVRDLHDCGLAHNALRPSSVLFDGNGRPVLISLGHTSALPPAYSALGHDARTADWAQFRSILDLVMERVELDGREAEEGAIERSVEELMRTDDERSAVDGLEQALFALAQPAPLVLRRSTIAGSAHAAAPADSEAAAQRSRRGSSQQSTGAAPMTARAAARAEAILDAGPVRMLKTALAPLVRSHRKQLLFGVLLAGVVGTAGLAAIPPDAPPAATTAATSAARRATATPTTTTGTAPADSTAQDDATAQDDPVTATAALLAARSRCFQRRSLSCLKQVDQPDSPLLAADSVAFAHPPDNVDRAKSEPSLIERTGNSALIELQASDGNDGDGQAKPTSALVIKG